MALSNNELFLEIFRNIVISDTLLPYYRNNNMLFALNSLKSIYLDIV
jgi:hypothetical protein